MSTTYPSGEDAPVPQDRKAVVGGRRAKRNARYADAVCRIVAQQPGPPGPAPEELRNLCSTDDPSAGTLHVAATDVGRAAVIGLAIGQRISSIHALPVSKDSAKQFQDILEAHTLQNGPIGLVRLLAVPQAQPETSLTDTLLECTIRDLYTQGVRAFVYPSWTDPAHQIRQQRALVRRAFYPIAMLPNYWYADSVNRRATCSRCGCPCCCSATLYFAYAFGQHIVSPVPAAGFTAANPEAYTAAAWPGRPVSAQLTLT